MQSTSIEAGVRHIIIKTPFPFTSYRQPERFFSRILPKDDNGCEIWAGMRGGNAGLVTLGHKSKRAHRVAFEFHHGPIPMWHQVLQTCKNPLCCAKEHLYASPNPTKKEKPPAKTVGRPKKFTPETIQRMRKMRQEGFTYAQLAEVFNTSAMMVLNICKFKSYAHVPPEEGLEPKQLP